VAINLLTNCRHLETYLIIIIQVVAYAVYERSRKVLALYIVIRVVIADVGRVSLNLRGNHTRSDIVVVYIGYKKRETSRNAYP
jgi:hypothetical protein